MKTNMLMKNILTVGAFLLFFLGTALPTMAQEAPAKPKHYYYNSITEMKVGDSIMVNPDSLYYLTGERISKWVYKVPHAIQQVGGKRYPHGILIQGIYSWVYPATITSVKPVEPIPAPEPEPEPVPEPEPELEPIPEPEPEPEPAPVDTIETVGEGADLGKGGYDVPVPYQRNRFAVGLRAGYASTLNKIDGKIPSGMNLSLDLRYGHYWAADKDEIAYGFQTGLDFTYVYGRATTMVLDDTYEATADGLKYHVAGLLKHDDNTKEEIPFGVTETTNQLLLEIPLFFSMSTYNGFYLNAGPKLLIPMATTFKQTMSDAHILAYEPVLNGKPLEDNPVYGQFAESQLNGYKGKLGAAGKVAIGLAAEAGYEFRSGLSIGGYIGYAFSTYSNVEPKSHLVDIVAPTDAAPGQVVVNSLTQVNPKGFGLFDLGVKISYNLDFDK